MGDEDVYAISEVLKNGEYMFDLILFAEKGKPEQETLDNFFGSLTFLD